MNLNPLTDFKTGVNSITDAITSHLPFGIGAQYNNDNATQAAYNYYQSPAVLKQRDATLLMNRSIGNSSRAAAENWYHTLQAAEQKQPLSYDPMVNIANRQKQAATPQITPQNVQAIQRIQALISNQLHGYQQPSSIPPEDEYTGAMAAQPADYSKQTTLNGAFIGNGPTVDFLNQPRYQPLRVMQQAYGRIR